MEDMREFSLKLQGEDDIFEGLISIEQAGKVMEQLKAGPEFVTIECIDGKGNAITLNVRRTALLGIAINKDPKAKEA